MKKIFLIFAFLIPSPSFAAETKCAQNQTIVVVDGMVCDFCAQGMIKTFKKNSAVSDVKIDLTTKKVTIDTKPGQDISEAEIGKLVDYSGYKLVKIERICIKKS